MRDAGGFPAGKTGEQAKPWFQQWQHTNHSDQLGARCSPVAVLVNIALRGFPHCRPPDLCVRRLIWCSLMISMGQAVRWSKSCHPIIQDEMLKVAVVWQCSFGVVDMPQCLHPLFCPIKCGISALMLQATESLFSLSCPQIPRRILILSYKFCKMSHFHCSSRCCPPATAKCNCIWEAYEARLHCNIVPCIGEAFATPSKQGVYDGARLALWVRDRPRKLDARWFRVSGTRLIPSIRYHMHKRYDHRTTAWFRESHASSDEA